METIDAPLTVKQKNDLPDSKFLYIKPGGEKDDTGRTTPRSLRMFPVPDTAHIRNALARIPQADISSDLKKQLTAKAERMLEATKDGLPSTLTDSDGSEVRRFDAISELHCDTSRSDGICMRLDETTGFLHGEARMARTGVQIYGDADGNTWGEYRDASEVFDEESLRSYDLATVTNDHPAEFVTTKNRASVDMGSVGTNARPDEGRFVRASLTVRDADTIQAIREGKRDLSMGYTALVIVAPGVTDDGTPFKGRQTRIRINHAAIVDRGRAGPACGVELVKGDAFSKFEETRTTMKMRKIKLKDGTEVEVPSEVADVYDASSPPFPPKRDPDDDDESEDSDSVSRGDETELNELRAKVDVLESAAAEAEASFTSRVDARTNLVADAREVLGRDVKVDGVADATLMHDIVAKVMPSMTDKLKEHKADAGYLRACYDNAMGVHRQKQKTTRETDELVFDALAHGAQNPLLDAIQHYHARADRSN